MFWLFRAARRLRELGILGMNRRNAAFILDHNPRSLYPLVDDKLRMARLCQRIGVPTPQVYAEVASYSMLRRLPRLLGDRGDFVIKPNRGSAGRGVLVIVGRDGKNYLRHNGSRIKPDALRQHFSDILSGMYSLGGQPDTAIVQQRIRLHPAFESITYKGIPDVRVILYRNEPAMAMLRLPTKASNGRANLHQGGIGTGIDLDSGITHHAVQRNRFINVIPIRTGPSSTCACRTGGKCSTCRGVWRKPSAWAISASILSWMRMPAPCCWRRTPGRAWRFRSPMGAACFRVCRRSMPCSSKALGPYRWSASVRRRACRSRCARVHDRSRSALFLFPFEYAQQIAVIVRPHSPIRASARFVPLALLNQLRQCFAPLGHDDPARGRLAKLFFTGIDSQIILQEADERRFGVGGQVCQLALQIEIAAGDVEGQDAILTQMISIDLQGFTGQQMSGNGIGVEGIDDEQSIPIPVPRQFQPGIAEDNRRLDRPAG